MKPNQTTHHFKNACIHLPTDTTEKGFKFLDWECWFCYMFPFVRCKYISVTVHKRFWQHLMRLRIYFNVSYKIRKWVLTGTRSICIFSLLFSFFFMPLRFNLEKRSSKQFEIESQIVKVKEEFNSHNINAYKKSSSTAALRILKLTD